MRDIIGNSMIIGSEQFLRLWDYGTPNSRLPQPPHRRKSDIEQRIQFPGRRR